MIRVIIADDHAIFREGLASLLVSASDIAVEGFSATGSETIKLVRTLRPDIGIVDVSMPDGSGIEVMEQVARERLPTKLIMLTMFKDTSAASLAMKAGASGFIPKDNAFDDLLYAIRTVHSGGTFISPSIAKELLNNGMNGRPACQPLSVKEREVLKMIAAGLTSKEIALKLKISIKTVETQRMRIMQKLDARKATDLVRVAVERGLL